MSYILVREMIRKVLLSLAAILFAGTVLGTSVIRTTAQTGSKFNPNSSATGIVSPTPTPISGPAKVDYYLPYPGILPDHLLYSLKALRDRVWLFLTTDPVKKSELLLLFADKRLGAGKALVEGGKTELGISTFTKGEKYLEQAIAQAEKAKEKDKETSVLYEKLSKATLKHEEVLQEVLLKVSDQAKPAIQDALRYSRQGYETVTR